MTEGKDEEKKQLTADERMAICKTCPSFMQRSKRCLVCGCWMTAKTRLKFAKCPVGKW